MENASKALLMAGGILIGVLLISIMVYVFNSASSMAQTFDEAQSQRRLEYFNSRFLGYNKVINGDARGNNPSEVVSAVNLAYDYNISYSSMNGEYDQKKNCLIVICDTSGKVCYQLPNGYQKRNCIKDATNGEDLSLNDFLRLYVTPGGTFTKEASGNNRLNDMKIISNSQGNAEVLYRYGFETVMHIDDYTKHVDKMAFILVPIDGASHSIRINGGGVNPQDYGLESVYNVKSDIAF